MSADRQLSFDSTKRRLFGSVLNEVLNGIALDDFRIVIGTERDELQKLLGRLHHLPEGATVELDLRQARILRNALIESLKELGVEEFQTRTGFSFEEGQNALEELSSLIGSDPPTGSTRETIRH